MSTIRKKEIDQELEGMFGIRENGIEVEDITTEFLHRVMRKLIAGHEVHLPGFGTFKVSVRKGMRQKRVTLTKGTFKKGEKGTTHSVTVDRKYYVSFRRAAAFRQMFWDQFGKNKTKK